MVTEKAYGKINVYLDVLGKRNDGYHDLEMIMINIGLHDEIIIKKLNDNEGKIFLTSDINLGQVEDNLIYKAAKVILERYNINSSISINLKKNIFVAAGLAGGSADCASTIKGLIKLFNILVDEKEILNICKNLGADVPYCYLGGTRLVKGIGDEISPLNNFPTAHVLLIKPNIQVLTKDIFSKLKKSDINKFNDRTKINNIINGINKGNIDLIEENFHNTLECVTMEMYYEIKNIKEDLMNNFQKTSLMSGSGPTVFALFKDKDEGEVAFNFIKNKYPHIKDLALTYVVC